MNLTVYTKLNAHPLTPNPVISHQSSLPFIFHINQGCKYNKVWSSVKDSTSENFQPRQLPSTNTIFDFRHFSSPSVSLQKYYLSEFEQMLSMTWNIALLNIFSKKIIKIDANR